MYYYKFLVLDFILSTFAQTSADPEAVVRPPEHLVHHGQVRDDVHCGDAEPEDQDHHTSLSVKICHSNVCVLYLDCFQYISCHTFYTENHRTICQNIHMIMNLMNCEIFQKVILKAIYIFIKSE